MIENYDQTCPLCRLTQDSEILTRLYFQDDLLMVVDCLVCHLPMAVLRAHRDYFKTDERQYAVSRLKEVLLSAEGSKGLIGPDHPMRSIAHISDLIQSMDDNPAHRWIIDFEQRQIPHHPHCHLRPFPFPGTSQWEYLD